MCGIDKTIQSTFMLMSQDVEPTRQGMAQRGDRRKRLLPDDLLDLVISLRPVQLLSLLHDTGFYCGNVRLRGVDLQRILPENLQRAQLAQPTNSPRHSRGATCVV